MAELQLLTEIAIVFGSLYVTITILSNNDATPRQKVISFATFMIVMFYVSVSSFS